jgi:hypothetical protein
LTFSFLLLEAQRPRDFANAFTLATSSTGAP